MNSRQLDDYLSRWRKTLGSAADGDATLVARVSGGVVGIVRVARSATPRSETGVCDVQLTGMHVEPGFTGQGIGTLLMERSLDFIREQGFNRVQLGVIAANTGARHFYESHGWVLVEELPDGTEGVPIVIYELG